MSEKTRIRGDSRSITAMTQPRAWANELTRSRHDGPGLDHKHWERFGDATKAVHSGTIDDQATGSVGTPIYQGSTFLLDNEQYDSIEQGHARDRFIYSRYGNPNQWAVQQKLAALENAESALVFSSGMAAITASIMALMDKGAHLVTANELYGGSFQLFNHEFPTMGMSVSYVDPDDFDAIEKAIQPNTQILFFEALTNPLLKLADVERLVCIAKKYQLRLIIDATFVTPLGCRYLDLGVDLVVHSASKYLNGHSDLIAGAVVGERKLVDLVWPKLLVYGGCLDPHASFLFERGLKTLPLRMRAHQESALALAQYLEQHERVTRIRYPLLESYPYKKLADRILKNGSGMISFDIKGGDEAALELLKALKLPKSATSLGGLESLISLPFNTSHAAFTKKQRIGMGILPGCIRLSVGVENVDDLIDDFEQAFRQLNQHERG